MGGKGNIQEDDMTQTLGKHSALARRYYHHVANGGTLTEKDIARLVEAIEKLEARVDLLQGEKSA